MKTTIRIGVFAFLSTLSALGFSAASLEEVERLSQTHQFDKALSRLEKIVRERPDHGGAWIKIASISLVTGDVERAREACRRSAMLVDPIVSVACQGRIALVAGGKTEAFDRLDGLLGLAHYSDRDDRETVWARGVAAELAASIGRSAAADDYFERSIAGGAPEQIHVAYADHLLATDRPQRVISLLRGKQGGYALQLRRVLAYRKAGLEDQIAGKLIRLDRAFRNELKRGELDHAREIAFFFVHVSPEPRLARRAALANIERQKEPEDYALLAAATRG